MSQSTAVSRILAFFSALSLLTALGIVMPMLSNATGEITDFLCPNGIVATQQSDGGWNCPAFDPNAVQTPTFSENEFTCPAPWSYNSTTESCETSMPGYDAFTCDATAESYIQVDGQYACSASVDNGRCPVGYHLNSNTCISNDFRESRWDICTDLVWAGSLDISNRNGCYTEPEPPAQCSEGFTAGLFWDDSTEEVFSRCYAVATNETCPMGSISVTATQLTPVEGGVTGAVKTVGQICTPVTCPAGQSPKVNPDLFADLCFPSPPPCNQNEVQETIWNWDGSWSYECTISATGENQDQCGPSYSQTGNNSCVRDSTTPICQDNERVFKNSAEALSCQILPDPPNCTDQQQAIRVANDSDDGFKYICVTRSGGEMSMCQPGEVRQQYEILGIYQDGQDISRFPVNAEVCVPQTPCAEGESYWLDQANGGAKTCFTKPTAPECPEGSSRLLTIEENNEYKYVCALLPDENSNCTEGTLDTASLLDSPLEEESVNYYYNYGHTEEFCNVTPTSNTPPDTPDATGQDDHKRDTPGGDNTPDSSNKDTPDATGQEDHKRDTPGGDNTPDSSDKDTPDAANPQEKTPTKPYGISRTKSHELARTGSNSQNSLALSGLFFTLSILLLAASRLTSKPQV